MEVWVGVLIAIVVSVISPVIVSTLAVRARRIEKEADWEREDEVARRVQEVATAVSHTQLVVNKKLDVIHTLVNSTLTAAIQSELGAHVSRLALVKQIIASDEKDGIPPTAETLAEVETIEQKIEELTLTLNDRITQTRLAEEQGAEQP